MKLDPVKITVHAEVAASTVEVWRVLTNVGKSVRKLMCCCSLTLWFNSNECFGPFSSLHRVCQLLQNKQQYLRLVFDSVLSFNLKMSENSGKSPSHVLTVQDVALKIISFVQETQRYSLNSSI